MKVVHFSITLICWLVSPQLWAAEHLQFIVKEEAGCIDVAQTKALFDEELPKFIEQVRIFQIRSTPSQVWYSLDLKPSTGDVIEVKVQMDACAQARIELIEQVKSHEAVFWEKRRQKIHRLKMTGLYNGFVEVEGGTAFDETSDMAYQMGLRFGGLSRIVFGERSPEDLFHGLLVRFGAEVFHHAQYELDVPEFDKPLTAVHMGVGGFGGFGYFVERFSLLGTIAASALSFRINTGDGELGLGLKAGARMAVRLTPELELGIYGRQNLLRPQPFELLGYPDVRYRAYEIGAGLAYQF